MNEYKKLRKGLKQLENLKEKAYNIIKDKILQCKLAPGETVDEKSLIEEIGVSRTPIREALNMLEREDMINIIPRRGIFVTHITLSDIYDIFQVREEIDPFIAKIATPNMTEEKLEYFIKIFQNSEECDNNSLSKTDTEFHSLIANSCNNKYLIKMMDGIYDQDQRIRILSHRMVLRREETVAEHMEIIKCFLEKDGDKAAEAMRRHVISSKNNALQISNFKPGIL